jgi:methylmalonyl-CoA mutase N-terminal domain/subunit
VLKIDPALEQRQAAKLADVRAQRSQVAMRRAVERIEAAARDGSNLMPVIIDAVRSYATLGEISDAMRRVYGEYRPTVNL